MRFVAGKGAVAELLLAWSRSGAVAGRGAVTERHREDAGRGAVAAEMLLAGRCWQDAAGRGAVTERHREEACQGAVAAEMLLAGRCWLGRYGGAVAGRGIAAEHCPSVNEIFYPFGCHQFTFFLNFAAVSALRPRQPFSPNRWCASPNRGVNHSEQMVRFSEQGGRFSPGLGWTQCRDVLFNF